MGAFDQKGEHTARLAASGEADRLRQRHLGVTFADDVAPAADNGTLHEAKALKGDSADLADNVAGGAGAPAARTILLFRLVLRHRLHPCHSEIMSANAAGRLIQHYVDNYRRLPWREPPATGSSNPYRVWLSEIMLQQTTVAA